MASAKVLLGAEVYTLVASNSIKKGDVLTVGLVCTPPVHNKAGFVALRLRRSLQCDSGSDHAAATGA